MTVLDLFSGIGGFSLGLERTGGFKTIAFCEIDPFCRKVLAKHWPGVPCFEDVRTLSRPRGFADVICGGFPCQDISDAGKREGLAGERSGLWREYLRIVSEVRPRFVIVENVSALLYRDRGMGDVLGSMAALRYDAEWDCISADELGAPHGRSRVWIVFTDADRQLQEGGGRESLRRRKRVTKEGSQAPADTDGFGKLELRRVFGEVRRWLVHGSTRGFWGCHWQAKFEALRGMDDGVPTRLDRDRDGNAISALGNALLPQIPELIGRAILKAEGLT